MIFKRLGWLVWAVVVAFVMRACVVEPVRVTDDSMQPSLVGGQVAFVSKLRYGVRVPGAGAMLAEWSAPRKGDVVVAVAVGDPPVNIVRRIAEVPGEKVKLADGKTVALAPGEFFVLADQGGDALDSRKIGPIPRRSIIGKVSYAWITKNPSNEEGSRVESEKSGWRMLQPVL